MPEAPPTESNFLLFRRVFFLVSAFLYLPLVYDNGISLRSYPFGDLPSFYYAAQTALRLRQSPYAPGALAWGTDTAHSKIWPFVYPPPTLLLFAPFAHLSYKAAGLLVLGATHLCILGLLALLMHMLGFSRLLWPAGKLEEDRLGTGPTGKELAAVFLSVYFFLFRPTVVTLIFGQTNFYVIFLLCLLWYALRKNAAPFTAALPLAFAIVLKTYPLLFLPILLIQGRWRVAAWTLGFLVLVTLISYAVLPHVVWHDWLTFVVPYGGYMKTPPGLFSPSEAANQSLNGFVSRLLLDPRTAVRVSPVAARLTAYALAAALYGTELFLSWRLSQAFRAKAAAGTLAARPLDLEFALFLLTMFLVAPLSWEHHLVFVLPAILLALAQIIVFPPKKRWTTVWVAAAAFVIAWTIPIQDTGGLRHFFHLFLSLKFYAVVAFWLYFAALLARYLRAERVLQEVTARAALP